MSLLQIKMQMFPMTSRHVSVLLRRRHNRFDELFENVKPAAVVVLRSAEVAALQFHMEMTCVVVFLKVPCATLNT